MYRQFPEDAREAALNPMSDNGYLSVSVRFMEACRSMGVNQAFTSNSSPKGNADTERSMRTAKAEPVRVNELTSLKSFLDALNSWIKG